MPNLLLRDLMQHPDARALNRVDTHMLLLHACGQDPLNRAWLLAHTNDTASPEQIALAYQFFLRRLSGEPVAYITGFKEFYGLRLNVDYRVLDPRDDTETLVDWALELIPREQPINVLDLGTGSGAIALAIKSQRPFAHVSATDASQDAIAVASGNALRLGLQVNFVQVDAKEPNWFASLEDQRFHFILSNPPYIAEGDDHLPPLHHEPSLALTSGADGLDATRNVIAHVAQHLEPKGWLILEHGHDQADAVQTLLNDAKFTGICTRRDISEKPRCTAGRLL